MFLEIIQKGETKVPDNSNAVHYVKFRRGSIAIWNSLLATPSQIDDDTLYFIYDTEVSNPTEGKLYLGQKLISGGSSSSGGIININDLSNVEIDGTTLDNKQILVFNIETGQWQNTSLSTIINTAVGEMVGAKRFEDGTSGLVPAPQAGDHTKFLRGDATWAEIIVPSFDKTVFSTVNNVVSLKGFDLAPAGAVPIKTDDGISWSNVAAGRLNKQLTTLEKLQAQLAGTDTDPLDTDAIYLVNNGSDGSNGSQYDEYIIVNNQLEKLGSFGQTDLTNYVTIPTFNTQITRLNDLLYDTRDENNGSLIPGLISRVSTIESNYITRSEIGDLNTLILSGTNTNLVQEVNTLHTSVSTIQERLKWKELQDQ